MAIDLASVIGSCSTGSATAVDNRTREVTAGRGAEADPRVQGAHVAVVGQRLVAGGGVRGLALDRDVGVLGHVERGKAVVVGELGRCRRGDAAVAGEKYEPVVHAKN